MTETNSGLTCYGFDGHFVEEAARWPGLFPARITAQHRELYEAVSEGGSLAAGVSGKLPANAESALDFPAVGDWVMIDRLDGESGNAVIHHVLRRKSVFVRQAAGTAREAQTVAANIDTVFICMSLNADFSVRRVERYLTIAWESRAVPVIVLTKSDLCENAREKIGEIAAAAKGVEIVACSAKNGDGLDLINPWIRPGKTVAFIGSSGAGKSTLVNRLAGSEILATKEIRENDGRGRHTTTHRQLVLLPGGGMVIDTPGMRELQIYSGDLARTFEDVEELAARCKFGDCSHGAEPGCAIRKAIKDGSLSEKRFESYQKLKREMSYDGLNSRQLADEKINRMFGGRNEMKQFFRTLKKRKGR